MKPPRSRSSGQALVLFVITSVLVMGMVALVIDIAWFWTNEQSMQKAADAGALAGAVYLPGNVAQAYSSAAAEAKKNGYVSGVNGVVVTPRQDSSNPRRLNVTITSPVQTYFAKAFCAVTTCIQQISERVDSTAEFTLPVPMGSPQNYYGVGTYLYNQISTSTSNSNNATGWDPEAGTVAGGDWTNPGNAATQNSTYATAAASGSVQQWNTFNLQSGTGAVPNNATLVVDGLEVQLKGVFLGGSGNATNCYVTTEVSWNGGTSWSSAQNTTALDTSNSTVKTLGSNSSTSSWGAHTWAYADFSNTNFRVRLTWLNGVAIRSCPAARTVSLDQLLVRVDLPHDHHHDDHDAADRRGQFPDDGHARQPGLLGRGHHARRQP